MRLQDDRLADLASDHARQAHLEAIAASVEKERSQECTFKPVLGCGTGRRLADQENTNPAAEVSLPAQCLSQVVALVAQVPVSLSAG